MKIALLLTTVLSLAIHASALPEPSVKIKPGFSELVISPDLKQCASVRDEKIDCWDLQSGKLIRTLSSPLNKILGVDYSPDGKTLAYSDPNGIEIWSTREWKLVLKIQHADYAVDLKFSPNSQWLAAYVIEDAVYFWDTKTGSLISEGGPSVLTALAFSPSSHDYVTAESGNMRDGKQKMLVTSVKSQKVRAKFLYGGDIHDAVFSRDDKMVITTGRTKGGLAAIDFWDIKAQKLNRSVSWKGAAVDQIILSPDGSKLASIGDETVRIWDMKKALLLRSFNPRKSKVVALRFTPDGREMVVATADGVVAYWPVGATRKAA